MSYNQSLITSVKVALIGQLSCLAKAQQHTARFVLSQSLNISVVYVRTTFPSSLISLRRSARDAACLQHIRSHHHLHPYMTALKSWNIDLLSEIIQLNSLDVIVRGLKFLQSRSPEHNIIMFHTSTTQIYQLQHLPWPIFLIHVVILPQYLSPL